MGLAKSFHALGNKVTITGRRQQPLEETVAANPGMQFRVLDQSNAEAIRDGAGRLMNDFPEMNVLINNAGFQAGG